jgi:hypothetical protein
MVRWFARFARRQRISEDSLIGLIARAEGGLIDADLGSGLVKLRLPRRGQGRSGGYRAIVVHRKGECAFFLYGYAKSEQDDLDPAELVEYKKAATHFMALTDRQIVDLLADGKLVEIEGYGEAPEK